MYTSNKSIDVPRREYIIKQTLIDRQQSNKINKCHTQAAFLLMVNTFSSLLIEVTFNFRQLIVWSDGCEVQYRLKFILTILSNYHTSVVLEGQVPPQKNT